VNFQGEQAKYRRIYTENAAWRLLRAENSPLILAFISELFADENEVPFSRARVVLDQILEQCRYLGIWDTSSNANNYLNQWIRAGWLREMDDMLTKTDASERAFRFCRSLDERSSGTTASHLKIVQEAVRDFSVALSPNVQDRVALLEQKKAEIQRELDNLNAGVVVTLKEAEKKERIKEIYQLASVLTGDFRLMEDEIRQLDQQIRVQIIEDEVTRGELLADVMEKEALLATTEAGSAFESFFQLLCDPNRATELRSQLQAILNNSAVKYLSNYQRQFLSHLMRELARESERVFKVRRRTEEGLWHYIESGAVLESKAVNKLIAKLEKAALVLRDEACDLRSKVAMSLDVGSVSISSPYSIKLKEVDATLDISDIKEKHNIAVPDSATFQLLDTIRIRSLAEKIYLTLKENGAMTIGDLINLNPIQYGLEELVAYIRIAKTVNATLLTDEEIVDVYDKEGNCLQASIPKLVLNSLLFPKELDELML
jgi:hypothetical protein